MAALAVCLASGALAAAVRWLPSAGPFLADALRFVVGGKAVTRLEQVFSRVEDSWKRALPEPAARSIHDLGVPSTSGEAAARPPAQDSASEQPLNVSPMLVRDANKEDGRWVVVRIPGASTGGPNVFATMLHPDPKRSWAEVFVVAVRTSRTRLYAVAGTAEPRATTLEGRAYERRGVIPQEHRSRLLFAFNGGFKTEHGQHGMFVDGVTLVRPKPGLCTIVVWPDGIPVIGTWTNVEPGASLAQSRVGFWRQGPPCMYERGELNPLLADENVRNWGATLDGNVVIRRSAIGLDAKREILFVGVSNDTTARAMAEAMHHAGATDVAQLDVNWSYPKIVIFLRNGTGDLRAEGLFKGFLFHHDDFVARPSERDFFYVLRAQ